MTRTITPAMTQTHIQDLKKKTLFHMLKPTLISVSTMLIHTM